MQAVSDHLGRCQYPRLSEDLVVAAGGDGSGNPNPKRMETAAVRNIRTANTTTITAETDSLMAHLNFFSARRLVGIILLIVLPAT